MGFQTSFKQILNHKLNDTANFADQNRAYPLSENSLDPSHMAYLIGNISRMQTSVPRGHYPAPKVRPQRKPHNLSNLQRQSFEFIKSWIHDFSEGFTEAELKKAFRQAAHILHPDHGGNAQNFMELKQHIDVLKSIFPKNT
jgi:hypothetical protein